MAHVSVVIAGKTYRMACGEGEEAHLTALAAELDARVAEMRKTFGEIGDMRLHVMAALTVCDELAETRARLASAEADVTALRETVEADETRFAEGIGRTAERIERLARIVSTAQSRAPAGDPEEFGDS